MRLIDDRDLAGCGGLAADDGLLEVVLAQDLFLVSFPAGSAGG